MKVQESTLIFWMGALALIPILITLFSNLNKVKNERQTL